MTEIELYTHVRAWLLPQMLLRAPELVGKLKVRLNQQPQQTARTNGPEVLFFQVMSARYGYPTRFERWNATTEEMETVQRSNWETTLQFNALYPHLPGDLDSLTPADMLAIASDAFQMDAFQTGLKALNAGVLRITDITNTPFRNDRDQPEFSPSFTVTITHVKEFAYPVGVVAGFESGIKRV